MANEPSFTNTEWKLIIKLLERERAELPVEIHHSIIPEAREYLRMQLDLVDQVLEKTKQTGRSSLPS